MKFLDLLKKKNTQIVANESKPNPIVRVPSPRPKVVGDYLSIGWRNYGVARGAFVSVQGYYAYERKYNLCALAAIYQGLTNCSFDEIKNISFDACEYGITRMLGYNIRHIYAPAVTSTEYVRKGQLTNLFSHLHVLTDSGFPTREIIDYAYQAQDYHNSHAK